MLLPPKIPRQEFLHPAFEGPFVMNNRAEIQKAFRGLSLGAKGELA